MVALIAFMSKRRKISKIINISESNDDFTVSNAISTMGMGNSDWEKLVPKVKPSKLSWSKRILNQQVRRTARKELTGL